MGLLMRNYIVVIGRLVENWSSLTISNILLLIFAVILELTGLLNKYTAVGSVVICCFVGYLINVERLERKENQNKIDLD